MRLAVIALATLGSVVAVERPAPRAPMAQGLRHRAPRLAARMSLTLPVQRGLEALLPSRSPAQLAEAGARTGLPIAFFAAANSCMGAGLRACGSSFSPSIASMLSLSVGLCALASVRPALTERVSTLLRPGFVVLSRWLPAFYLPSLVALAFARPSVSAPQLLGFVAFCIASLFANAGITVALMRAFRPRRPLAAPSTPPPAVSATPPEPWARPRPRLLATRLCALALASATAALACGTRAPAAGALAVQSSLFFATALGLALGELVPARARRWVHPIVTATAFASLALAAAAAVFPTALAGTPYASGAGAWLGGMLAPTVASFALALYSNRASLARSLLQLLGAIGGSACLGLVGSALAARALGIEPRLALALLPRSITTPLALEAAGLLGADRELALLAVCATGLFTIPFGRPLMRAFRIHDPAERGVALGCAGNGGSTLALAEDTAAFPFAVSAMVLSGAWTVVLLSAPPVRRLLLALLPTAV